MIINSANMSVLNTSFNAAFMKGEKAVESFYKTVAMTVPSTAESETYAWLGQMPRMREWIGDRVIKSLSLNGYRINNRKFEETIEVERTKIEDDNYGVYAPLFEELGCAAAEKPDELVAELIRGGFTTTCYDGQYFFDVDHPVSSALANGEEGPKVSVSNYDAGSGEGWFLFDTSRMIKPFIYQERIPAKLTKLDSDNDENVFMRDQYLYGVRARMNVGYGLWQLAYGSRQTLDFTNYEAARRRMMTFRGDGGRLLGIKPNVLIVSPNLEGAAREIVGNQLTANGGTNKWYGTAQVIVTPWLTPPLALAA